MTLPPGIYLLLWLLSMQLRASSMKPRCPLPRELFLRPLWPLTHLAVCLCTPHTAMNQCVGSLGGGLQTLDVQGTFENARVAERKYRYAFVT